MIDRIIGRPGRERAAFWRGFRYMFIRFNLVAMPLILLWLLWRRLS